VCDLRQGLCGFEDLDFQGLEGDGEDAGRAVADRAVEFRDGHGACGGGPQRAGRCGDRDVAE